MYLCVCKGVKESDLRHLADHGAVTAADLIVMLGLDDEACCGLCLLRLDEFEDIVRRERQRREVLQAVEQAKR